jgi:hypothetical protein
MRIMWDITSVRSHILALKLKAQQFPVVQAPDNGQNAGSPKVQQTLPRIIQP